MLTASEGGRRRDTQTTDGYPTGGGLHARAAQPRAGPPPSTGLRERFCPLGSERPVVDIWNADGGTGSEGQKAYNTVPFCLTAQAPYGVGFVNDPGRVSFESASARVCLRLQCPRSGKSA